MIAAVSREREMSDDQASSSGASRRASRIASASATPRGVRLISLEYRAEPSSLPTAWPCRTR